MQTLKPKKPDLLAFSSLIKHRDQWYTANTRGVVVHVQASGFPSVMETWQ